MAWPYHVHTQSARQARLRTKAGCNQRRWRRAAVRSNVAFAGGPRQRDDEPPLLVESDLSGEMAVGDQELDAIIRLLGGALDDILSGTGGE